MIGNDTIEQATEDMKRPNPLPPDRMTAAERLAEITEILAAGILRLKERESTHAGGDRRDLSLDNTAHESLHARNRRRRETAWKITC